MIVAVPIMAWASGFAIAVAEESVVLAALTVVVALAYTAAALLADRVTSQAWVPWVLLGCAVSWPMTGTFPASGDDFGPVVLFGVMGQAMFQLLVALVLVRCLPDRQELSVHEAGVGMVLFTLLLLRVVPTVVLGGGLAWIVTDLLLMAGCVALILGRDSSAAGLQRRAVQPVLVGGGVAFAGSVGSAYVLVPDAAEVRVGAYFVSALAALALPAGVVVSRLRQRLAYGALAEELAWLPWPATPAAVRTALRRALQDECLDVLCWQPEQGRYVDVDGRPVREPVSADLVSVPLRGDDGQRVALVTADARLALHEDLLLTAVASSSLGLLNTQMMSGLRTQAEELRLAQLRVEEARLEERRQLGRDLHDGVQLRLAALTLRLAELSFRSGRDDQVLRVQLDEARREVQGVLADLRSVARGIQPVLAEEGLGAALESLAERQPLPVTVRAPDERHSPAVEVAAYYVVAEALANTLKHARAHRADVLVSREPSSLRIEVTDDGVGGARDAAGSGLQGLRDRLRMLDGTLSVESPEGCGTIIRAVIPCG